MREPIVDVLMRRDGISREEAEDLVQATRREFYDSLCGDSDRDPVDILADNLGLEPDYLFDLI